MIHVGGADQGKFALVGNGKDDTAVCTLKEIAFVMIKQTARDDMTALDQTHPFGRLDVQRIIDNIRNPRACRIDQHPRGYRLAHTGFSIFNVDMPNIGNATRLDHLGTHHYLRSTLLRIPRIQHHQPRIIDPAVRIFKCARVGSLQRYPFWCYTQIQRRGRRQNFAPAQMIIEKKPQPDQKRRSAPLHPWHQPCQHARRGRFGIKSHICMKRKNKPHRPADVRHCAQQGFTLCQSMAHQVDFEILQIAQTTMKQLG